MASGSDGNGGLLARQRIGMARARQRRMAELEDKRDRLQEEIDELRDEIYYLAEGISETSYDETVDNAIASSRAKLDKLEDKRDALQKDIDAL